MTTTIERTGGAVRPKEFHFPVGVEWTGGRRVVANVAGKQAIEITPPPEFRGTDPTTWSPEDFFVAAAASCLAVTFTGLAGRAGLAYTGLRVDGDGVAGMRPDGRFGFTRLRLAFHVEVDPADTALARELAEKAEEACLVVRVARRTDRHRDRSRGARRLRSRLQRLLRHTESGAAGRASSSGLAPPRDVRSIAVHSARELVR